MFVHCSNWPKYQFLKNLKLKVRNFLKKCFLTYWDLQKLQVGTELYFCIVDAYTMFKAVTFLGAEPEALEKFYEIIAGHGVPNFLGCGIGEETNSKHFKWCCVQNKIQMELVVVQVLEQNGIAEKEHWITVEMIRFLLLRVRLPKPYCLRAIVTACYLRNRVTIGKEENGPFEKPTATSFNYRNWKPLDAQFLSKNAKFLAVTLKIRH